MTRYTAPEGSKDVHVFQMQIYTEPSRLTLFPNLYTPTTNLILVGEDVLEAWHWLEFPLNLLHFGKPPLTESGKLNYFEDKYSITHLFPPKNKLGSGIGSKLTQVPTRIPHILLHLDAEDFVDYSDTGERELNGWERNKIRSKQIPNCAGEEILRRYLERRDPDLHKLLEQTELDQVLTKFSEKSGWQYRVIVRSFNPTHDSGNTDCLES